MAKTTHKKKATPRGVDPAKVPQVTNNELMKCLSADHERIEKSIHNMEARTFTRIDRLFDNFTKVLLERHAYLESRLPAAPAPAEDQKIEPEFKVGDLVVADNLECNFEQGSLLRVTSVLGRSTFCTLAASNETDAGVGECTSWLRPATPEEITTYKEEQQRKEWEKVTELQEGDACDCATEQRSELGQLAKGGCVLHSSWPSGGTRWPVAYNKKYGVYGGGDPQMYNYTKLTFPEFKRRLQGTIARLEKERIEAEAKKPLVKGTLVKFRDGRTGEYLSSYTSGQGLEEKTMHWLLLKRAPLAVGWEWNTIQCERSSFTVITPTP